MKRRIIIENRSEKPDTRALRAVERVIESGRISNYGKQYCYATTFADDIIVYSDLNKSSDRFVVEDYKCDKSS